MALNENLPWSERDVLAKNRRVWIGVDLAQSGDKTATITVRVPPNSEPIKKYSETR